MPHIGPTHHTKKTTQKQYRYTPTPPKETSNTQKHLLQLIREAYLATYTYIRLLI